MAWFLVSPSSLYLAASLTVSQAGWQPDVDAAVLAAREAIDRPAATTVEDRVGCAYCDGGLCSVCGHGIYSAIDHSAGWNRYEFGAQERVAAAPAPCATEPDDLEVASNPSHGYDGCTSAEMTYGDSAAIENADGSAHVEEGRGLLADLAAAVSKVPGLSWLRSKAASAISESARGLRAMAEWSMGRETPADDASVANSGEAARRWFDEEHASGHNPEEYPSREQTVVTEGSPSHDNSSDFAEESANPGESYPGEAYGPEPAPAPAVTAEVAPDLAGEGYPTEAYQTESYPSDNYLTEAEGEVPAEAPTEAPAEAPAAESPAALGDAPTPEEFLGRRPALRSAAVVLEGIGRSILNMSERIHALADEPLAD